MAKVQFSGMIAIVAMAGAAAWILGKFQGSAAPAEVWTPGTVPKESGGGGSEYKDVLGPGNTLFPLSADILTGAGTGRPGSPENPLVTEIPAEMISYTGEGSWYEKRRIKELLGWTPEQYAIEIQHLKTTPVESRTWQQMIAGGYADNVEDAKYQDMRNDKIRETGGSFQNGVLTPPATFQGSITDYSRYVEQLAKEALGQTAPFVRQETGEIVGQQIGMPPPAAPQPVYMPVRNYIAPAYTPAGQQILDRGIVTPSTDVGELVWELMGG